MEESFSFSPPSQWKKKQKLPTNFLGCIPVQKVTRFLIKKGYNLFENSLLTAFIIMSCNSPSRMSLLYYFDENTFLTTLTSITFVVIGIFIYIFRAYSYLEKLRIPTAIQPLAPFGHIKDVVFQNSTLYECFWNYYNKCKRKRYIFGGLYLFFQPAVLLVHPVLQKEILEDNIDLKDFTSSPKQVKVHKDVELFSDEIFKNFWEKFKGSKENILKNIGDDPDIANIMHSCLMEATKTLFGLTIEEEVLRNLVNNETCSSFRRCIEIIYPCFKRKKSITAIKDLMDNTIQNRKKNDVKSRDVLGNYIRLRNVDDQETLIAELIHSFVQNIVFSKSTVLFCLYELSFNYEIQKELIEEIRRFDTSSVTLEEIEKLSYLEAVVKETFRKYPPVPYVLKKINTDYENTEFGLKLPKNAYVIGSTLGIHHDSTNYPNPECFDPGRFLESISNIYLPFGINLANTASSRLTVNTVKMILLILLSRYKVILTNYNASLEFDNSKVNVHPKEPLPIKLESIK